MISFTFLPTEARPYVKLKKNLECPNYILTMYMSMYGYADNMMNILNNPDQVKSQAAQ